jgi:hypothetical protein
MPRPAALAAAAAAATALALWLAWPVAAEDQVRRAVRDAVADFDEAAIRDLLDALDGSFVDDSGPRRIDRETIRLGLLGAARSGLRPRSWQLRLIPPIEVPDCAAEAGRASARFVVRLYHLGEGAEYLRDGDLRWEVEIDAELRRGEDGRWRFVRSTHRTLAGRPPYR